MKAEINENSTMVFICENDDDLQQVKAWTILNNGIINIPKKRDEYAKTEFNNLKVIICTESNYIDRL